jgi:phospholipid/cholesterol/gamma-HCH transport system substrate-binding protein
MKRRDEVLVGIVATAAVGLGVVGSLYLARGGLLPGYEVYSVFDWGAGLRQGQPVMLSGVSVGYVATTDIRRDGKLIVGMRIYKRYEVPLGTTARVAPNGVFGDMMVTLQPSRATDDHFTPGDTIPAGAPTVGMGEILGKVDSIGRDVQALTRSLRTELVDEHGLADLRRTVAAAQALIETLDRVAAEQSRELTRTQQSVRRVAGAIDSAQVDSTLHAVGDLAGNVAKLTADLQGTAANLDAVLRKLESGEGSAARLLNDDGLYRDTRALLQRLDSLTADFQRNPRKYIKLSVF